ncbi:unnamed protein product, partial [Mesorhabditis spiculigera]
SGSGAISVSVSDISSDHHDTSLHYQLRLENLCFKLRANLRQPATANPSHLEFPICTPECGAQRCQCNSGYYRNVVGGCVPLSQCPPVCPTNSSYNSCGSSCERTCAQRNPICPAICGPGKCMCNAGYSRNTAGNCILERDCPPTCPGFSTWQTCSSYCEPTCTNPNPVCNRACAPAKCQCNPGYYRSPSGLCVQWNQCCRFN